MFTVSLEIPGLEGNVPDDPTDAARSFIGAVRDWLDGALDTLALDVTDDQTGTTVMVSLNAVETVALLDAERTDR